MSQKRCKKLSHPYWSGATGTDVVSSHNVSLNPNKLRADPLTSTVSDFADVKRGLLDSRGMDGISCVHVTQLLANTMATRVTPSA